MLDLKQLESNLDAALNAETKESLTAWLKTTRPMVGREREILKKTFERSLKKERSNEKDYT